MLILSLLRKPKTAVGNTGSRGYSNSVGYSYSGEVMRDVNPSSTRPNPHQSSLCAGFLRPSIGFGAAAASAETQNQRIYGDSNA